jgi:hypothetical protein
MCASNIGNNKKTSKISNIKSLAKDAIALTNKKNVVCFKSYNHKTMICNKLKLPCTLFFSKRKNNNSLCVDHTTSLCAFKTLKEDNE